MDLDIVVEAAMGHRGDWLLKAAELSARSDPGENRRPRPGVATDPVVPGTNTANIDQQALEAVLNKVLDRQSRPSMKNSPI